MRECRFAHIRPAGLLGDSGATMVEYSIMLALIAAVSIGIILTLGIGVLGLFEVLDPF